MAGQAETAVRVRIEGRVQGVGFRYWVIDRATALGLGGWVRNRFDGSVEAVFVGAAPAVAGMIESCREGPAFARVTRVAEHPEKTETTTEPGFRLAPTA